MSTLFETVSAAFSRETTTHLAARLGEGKACVDKALAAAVPVVLSGLAGLARMEGGQTVMALGLQAHAAAPAGVRTVTGQLAILGAGPAPDGALRRGETLVAKLLGASGPEVAAAIAAQAGVRAASVQLLLQLAAAVLPALLWEHAAHHRLSADALAAALKKTQADVLGLAPRGVPVPAAQPTAFTAGSAFAPEGEWAGLALLLRQGKLGVAAAGLCLLGLLGLQRLHLPVLGWGPDAMPAVLLDPASTLARGPRAWSLAR